MFGLTKTCPPTRSPFMHTHKTLISALLLALGGWPFDDRVKVELLID